ncbi:Carboxypeptidase A4 [Tupaia chinensis]|uniref:Carboxypeptidase A4 n=1 Tax=Tupaia chinensis TaxID=246437 RepID=L9JCM7_TUPCH|nr:Carboxypeptidase A4 [Tupaia chinensis]
MRWILFFGALIGSSICGREKFFGDQVFRINVRNGDEVSKLRQLVNSDSFKLNVWKSPTTFNRPVDVLVPSVSLLPVKAFLTSHGLEYSVTIEDIQIYHEMDSIAADFPDLASRVKIGHSFENRTMYVLKFSTGGGKQRPAIWLNAGIHSREWISQATAIWTARKVMSPGISPDFWQAWGAPAVSHVLGPKGRGGKIVTDYQKDPALTSILQKMDIFLLPVANPDGYVYTQTHNRLWRKTRSLNPGSRCFGTDPNRNWDANFAGEGTSNNPCSEIYHGPHANSEVEVKSVVDFIQEHGHFKGFIDLHSYSQLLMYPYAYTVKKAPDAAELVSDVLLPRVSLSLRHCQDPASGSSVDWAYDNGIKYAFTFELRDTGHFGFLLPAKQIIPTAEETWLGLKVIMEHVRDNLY